MFYCTCGNWGLPRGRRRTSRCRVQRRGRKGRAGSSMVVEVVRRHRGGSGVVSRQGREGMIERGKGQVDGGDIT